MYVYYYRTSPIVIYYNRTAHVCLSPVTYVQTRRRVYSYSSESDTVEGPRAPENRMYDRPGWVYAGILRGYQDESGFKFLSELVSVYLRASGLNRDLNLKFSTGRT